MRQFALTLHMKACLYICITLCVAFSASLASAEDVQVYGPVKNVELVYDMTEYKPGQFKIYVKPVKLDNRESCVLFVAKLWYPGKQVLSGGLASTAIFDVLASDRPFWFTFPDVRVEDIDEWRAKHASDPPSSYGNACLETKERGQKQASEIAWVQLPADKTIPCNARSLDVIGVRATQVIVIGRNEISIQTTQPDSVRVFTSKLSDIDPASFQVVNGDGSSELSYVSPSAEEINADNKNHSIKDQPDKVEIYCGNESDAKALQHRIISAKSGAN